MNDRRDQLGLTGIERYAVKLFARRLFQGYREPRKNRTFRIGGREWKALSLSWRVEVPFRH